MKFLGQDAAPYERPEDAVLDKFTRRGFNNLSLEELALTQVSTAWKQDFEKATGESWDVYQAKAAERLKRANFDMKWLTKRTDNVFNPLLTAVVRGDMPRVTEYLRTHDVSKCKEATDDTCKTCLHLAAKEGHNEIVELLLSKGWHVNARDRLQNTPLHLACYRGHAPVIQSLLRAQADLNAGDTAGRKAIHYACSAMDAEALKTILRHDRNAGNAKDNAGRGPTHYLVYNNSPKQGELLRVMIEYGLRLDQPDNAGRTALHYACEAARAKCVSALLKNGARLDQRDSEGKTPLDLTRSDQIHTLISLYLKPDSDRLPHTPPPRSAVTPTRSRPQEAMPLSSVKMERKDTLYSLLRRIQEAGVTGQQHLKKPHLFSGAWMDAITTPPSLLNELGILQPAEAVLRVFNVLYPYQKPLPTGKGDEDAIMGFYGEAWTLQSDIAIIDPGDEPVLSKPLIPSLPSADMQRLKDFESQIASQDKEILRLRQELRLSEAKVRDLQQKVPLMDHLAAMEGERDQAFAIKEKLQKEVISLRQLIESLKIANDTLSAKAENAPKREELADLQKELSEKDAKDRTLRFKSGLLFLKSLDSKDDCRESAPGVHLQDGQVIERLTTALGQSKPGLKQILIDADLNADGMITKAEMTKVMDSLGVMPQDTLALLRIAGFRSGVRHISIPGFVNIIETWASKRELLISRLFMKLKEKFKGKPLTEIFSALDVNKDGTISFTEFGEAVNQLKLNMSREERHAVFAVLDGDHCGAISLEELRGQIEVAREAPPTQDENEAEEPVEFAPDSVGESVYNPGKTPELKAASPMPGAVKTVGKAPPDTKGKSMADTKGKTGVSEVLNGRLYVQVVKGRELPPGKYSVQCSLPGADGPIATDIQDAPTPQWKFRGRLKVSAMKMTSIMDVCIDLIGSGGKPVGGVSLNWSNCLSRPGAWAINGEYPLKDKGGKAKGFAILQLKWVPAGQLKLEGTGTLSLEPLRLEGGPPSALLFFSLCDSTVRTAIAAQSWSETLQLTNVRLVVTKPIPQLGIQVVDSKSQKVVGNCYCGWDAVAATPGQSSGLVKVTVGEQCAVIIKMVWRPRSEEEELMHKYATKIQAAWRAKKARERLHIKKAAARKLLKRQGAAMNGKFYLIDVLEEDGETIAELHPAGNPSDPLYTVLDSQPIAADQIPTVAVGPSDKLLLPRSSQPSPPHPPSKPPSSKPQPSPQPPKPHPPTSPPSSEPLSGDLGVRVIAATKLTNIMLKFVVGTAFAHSLSGPPWPRAILIPNVNVGRDQAKVEITVVEVATRSDKYVVVSDFGVSFSTPNDWSSDQPIPLPDGGSLTVQYQWLAYPASKSQENTAASKLQAAWKGKQTRADIAVSKGKPREVVARKGVKTENGGYYLVSVVKEEGGGVVAELHPIGDPAVPVYTVLDSLPVPEGREDDLSVTPAGKLTLSGQSGPQPSPQSLPAPLSKGDLAIKVISASGLTAAMLKITVVPAFAHSLSGPPWPRPIMIANVGVKGERGYAEITVVEVATRTDLIRKTIEFSLLSSHDWSAPIPVQFSPSQSITIQYQWLAYPVSKQQEEAAAVKLQSVWRGKEARNEAKSQVSKKKELLGRQGVKGKDSGLYMISFYKDEEGVIVSLNQTGNPERPVYEEVESLRISSDEPIEVLRERATVNENGRLQFS